MKDKELVIRGARAALVAGGLSMFLMPLVAALDPSGGESLYGAPEPAGWVLFALAFPFFALVPLPADHRWLFGSVRGVSAGLAAGFLAYYLARPHGSLHEGLLAVTIATLVAAGTILYAWQATTQASESADVPEPPTADTVESEPPTYETYR